jgi:DNA-binding transcriptional LysR family regulator
LRSGGFSPGLLQAAPLESRRMTDRKAGACRAGVGIMLVPSVAAGTLRDDIVVRRLPRTFPPREIYAAVTRGSRAPAVDELLACLREVAESRPTIDPLP